MEPQPVRHATLTQSTRSIQAKSSFLAMIFARLVESLRKASGDHVKGRSMISITNPDGLPAAKQEVLTRHFTDLL